MRNLRKKRKNGLQRARKTKKDSNENNFIEKTVRVKKCRKCGGTELVSPSLGSYSPETLLLPGVNEMTGVKECVRCGFCGFPEVVEKKIRERVRANKASSERKQGFFNKLGQKLFGKR